MTTREAKKLSNKTHFYNETFGMYYHFIDNKEDYEKLMLWMGVHVPTLFNGRCEKLENGDNGEIRIIIGAFNDDDATLVHECIHAGLFTMEEIGQSVPYDDELLPYLSSWIFRECKKKLNKEAENDKPN